MRKEASLSIVVDLSKNKILMVCNKRGINKGFFNFPGGKKEADEAMLECVIRETFEETGIKIINPKKVGYVEFPENDFFVTIYKSVEFEGNIKQNPEENDVFWWDLHNIPYEKMRKADADFVPLLLKGEEVFRRYFYDEKFDIRRIEIINDKFV